MSNHHHTDITDPEGNIVPFKQQQQHSLLARGLNALRGRKDTFWSGPPDEDSQSGCPPASPSHLRE